VQVDDALVDSHLEKEECHTYLIQEQIEISAGK